MSRCLTLVQLHALLERIIAGEPVDDESMQHSSECRRCSSAAGEMVQRLVRRSESDPPAERGSLD